MPTVIVEVQDRLARITLNRPEVRNAINLEMIRELEQALSGLAARDDVGALVLTGAGGQAFAGGADIRELRERGSREALLAINQSLFRKVDEFPWPTIAAVRGYALGGGCELAMACDLRIAGESAKFGQPEVGLGILPGAGGTQRLPRLVGIAKAKELIFTGAIIDAREAERIGLVNRVAPDDAVLGEAEALARKILAQGPLAVRLSKLALNASLRAAPETGFLIEMLSQGVLFDSEDKRARMTAFLEKKKPKP